MQSQLQKNIILLIVAFAILMETIDATVINTAIPAMAQSLQVNPIDLKLALISYLISLAIFIPISGWVADKFGVKNVFMLALFIFTVSSIACGFSENLGSLVFFRILQGVGGSFTLPVGRLIIVRTCERHELIAKTSITVMVGAVGMMLGPVLGGFITEHFSWHWIFWINVPVGLIGILLTYSLLPTMPPKKVHRLDFPGFLLFGTGLAFLISSLSMLSDSHIYPVYALLVLGLAIFLLTCYILHSRHLEHPIVNTNLLRSRTFRISIYGNLFGRLGFSGLPFLLPLYLQISFHFSPQKSGLLLAPTALGVLLVKPISLAILRRFGYKTLLLSNTLLIALSLMSFAFVTQTTPVFIICMLTLVYGVLVSLQYTGMNSLAYAELTDDEVSSATSIVSTNQQLSQSLGVALTALTLTAYQTIWFHSRTLSLILFQYTFLTIGIITLTTFVIFTFLKEEDGQVLIHRPLI